MYSRILRLKQPATLCSKSIQIPKATSLPTAASASHTARHAVRPESVDSDALEARCRRSPIDRRLSQHAKAICRALETREPKNRYLLWEATPHGNSRGLVTAQCERTLPVNIDEANRSVSFAIGNHNVWNICRSHHRRNGARQIIHIVLCNAGNIDAAGVSHINAIVFFELINLFCIDA